jgi:two-component system C4-dicarboxylate transport sensor histidine kinase DctB
MRIVARDPPALCGFPPNTDGEPANSLIAGGMFSSRLVRMLRPRWRLIVGVVAISLLVALAFVAMSRWVSSSAAEEARLAAAARMRANAGLFESELQKYRLLPLVLAENSDVISLAQSYRPDLAQQLNVKLRSLAQHTGISVIYVIDAKGKTIVSSNFDLPTSFLGENYAFRPYFRQAMAGRNSEYFALGAVSGRPGLFFSQRIANGEGVVVAKITLEKLEEEWAKQPGATLIRDRYGVVTVASNKNWVLHTTRPLPPRAHEEAQRTRQFGAAMPASLPFVLPPPARTAGAEEALVELAPGRRYAIVSTVVPFADWTLSSLEPLESALAAAKTRALAFGLVAALVLVVGFGLLFRSLERRRLLIASRHMLEEEVRRRTAELRGTNEQLVLEVAERERASRRLRKAREELAQANRLGSIGQITAGVAHEINQPVAAIRTFAENAKILMGRSDLAQTAANLDLIVDLTSRIGRITSELRSFARRDPPPVGEVRISDALEGALILIGDRVRAEGATLVMPDDDSASMTVLADRVRLEQVIINLLQNSLDALAQVEQRKIEIRIDARPAAKDIMLTVDDNGAGLPAALQKTVFKPFVTGKKHGLGLGLGIAQDIVREFGGELVLGKSRLGGTAFSVTLLKP